LNTGVLQATIYLIAIRTTLAAVAQCALSISSPHPPTESPPIRKLLLALICVFGMTGLVLATEVVLVKHDGDKKEVTVKEGDKEVVYKYTDKTKVSFIDKSGNAQEGTLEAAIKVLSNEKLIGKKFEVVTEKDTITELKLKGRKGK